MLIRGSTNTSSICERPVSEVNRRATWVVPPESRPGIADAVSIGSVGCHVPLNATVPTGIGRMPERTL